MDVLDIPRRLLSMVPFIGGSNEPDRAAPEARRPPPPAKDTKVAEQPPVAEDDDQFDDPEDEEEEEEEEEDEPDEEELDEDGDDDEDDDPDDVDDDSEPGDDGEADDDATIDISGTTAPSIGPNTVIEKEAPEKRLARGDQSGTDAMGLEKRREVIGGNYSAGVGKQLIRWAAVILVIVAAGFGAKLLVDDLDEAPAKAADRAPWAGNEQTPAPLE